MNSTCSPRARSPPHLCLLVGIVAHDEAEEQPGHDDVAQPQHGEVAAVLRRGEDELAGQREAGRVPGHVAAEVELAGHRAHRVVGRSGRHLRLIDQTCVKHIKF